MYSIIKKIFSNPVINFILATLVAFSFFYFSKSSTEISYSVSKEEIIVSKPDGTPELTFHWKGEPVTQDLKRIKVAIWNSGNTYIDYSSISKTIKFQLKASGEISIMSQKISSLSRQNLNVTSSLDNEDKGVIDIKFNGDDAIEVNDGFVITIFYVGDEVPKLKLLGRVKGINNLFEVVKWSSIKSPLGEDSTLGLLIFCFIFICSAALMIPLFNFTIKDNLIETYKCVAFVLGSGLCILPIILFFSLANVMYFGISWVL